MKKGTGISGAFFKRIIEDALFLLPCGLCLLGLSFSKP